MKQAIRWIGIGITVAAAATMLMADMVLAQPGPAAHTAPSAAKADAASAVGTAMQQPATAFAITVETTAQAGYKNRNRGSA